MEALKGTNNSCSQIISYKKRILNKVPFRYDSSPLSACPTYPTLLEWQSDARVCTGVYYYLKPEVIFQSLLDIDEGVR